MKTFENRARLPSPLPLTLLSAPAGCRGDLPYGYGTLCCAFMGREAILLAPFACRRRRCTSKRSTW